MPGCELGEPAPALTTFAEAVGAVQQYGAPTSVATVRNEMVKVHLGGFDSVVDRGRFIARVGRIAALLVVAAFRYPSPRRLQG